MRVISRSWRAHHIDLSTNGQIEERTTTSLKETLWNAASGVLRGTCESQPERQTREDLLKSKNARVSSSFKGIAHGLLCAKNGG